MCSCTILISFFSKRAIELDTYFSTNILTCQRVPAAPPVLSQRRTKGEPDKSLSGSDLFVLREVVSALLRRRALILWYCARAPCNDLPALDLQPCRFFKRSLTYTGVFVRLVFL